MDATCVNVCINSEVVVQSDPTNYLYWIWKWPESDLENKNKNCDIHTCKKLDASQMAKNNSYFTIFA